MLWVIDNYQFLLLSILSNLSKLLLQRLHLIKSSKVLELSENQANKKLLS